MTDLYDSLSSFCTIQGTTYFGVADLTSVQDEVIRQGGEMIRYPHAVVFGIALQQSIVDMLGEEGRAAKIMYHHHAYQVINSRLDSISSVVADLVQKAGYSALPVPASVRVDNDRICSLFSHKLAARQAGFGWIGKSCMLITPDYGPRVRWGSVLTDAPLPAVSGPMEEQCGECQACVDICPVKAYTGAPFLQDEPREVRFDAERCDRYFQEMKKRNEEPVCGLCLYVCPYGRKGNFFMQSGIPR